MKGQSNQIGFKDENKDKDERVRFKAEYKRLAESKIKR